MRMTFLFRLAVMVLFVGLASGCANTIRGMGQDTAEAVDATQQAGRTVQRSTY